MKINVNILLTLTGVVSLLSVVCCLLVFVKKIKQLAFTRKTSKIICTH